MIQGIYKSLWKTPTIPREQILRIIAEKEEELADAVKEYEFVQMVRTSKTDLPDDFDVEPKDIRELNIKKLQYYISFLRGELKDISSRKMDILSGRRKM